MKDNCKDDLLNQTINRCGKPAGHPHQNLGNHAAITAYGLALANGFRGTLQEWLDSLVGPQGPQGLPGGAVVYITDELDEHGGTIRHINAVDISNDTVTPEVLQQGYTAHNALGQPIVGTGSGGGAITPATTSTLGGIIVGSDLLVTAQGVLSVDKATSVEEDNTRPITAAAVFTEVGNIDALLQTI